jgi:mono/diheme cytochrome c family protein/uncharacterized membrane protein
LLTSILDGKGKKMPPQRGKLSEEQARDLVAYVRSFAPTMGKAAQEQQQELARFEERYRRLQEQLDWLREQFRKLSKDSRGGTPVKPPESRPQQVTQPPVPAEVEVSQPSVPVPTGTSAVRGLFGQHCVKCHGKDGTGSPARDRLSQIPDFTQATWQARRSDAQLVASILDGKGKDMPPGRGKLSGEQARDLLALVRAFAPAAEKPPQDKQAGSTPPYPWSGQEERPARGEPAEPTPPRGFSEKLIRWLGSFHPPVVHFPIAMLTAAALAELLRIATGKPAFDAVTRYCVWFGALTAIVAGGLGWFLGGFALTDTSWVLMTHRWLGTSTVTCAGLVLILGELSRRPDRRQARMWFRATLMAVAVLVLVTGFFGGAVVFGLDHHSWPR